MAMDEQGAPGGPPEPAVREVVRARRVEVVDESGRPRILLGELGRSEGTVFGVSVLAAEPATGVHLTADRSSAGIAVSRLGDEVVGVRAHAGEGRLAAVMDLGEAGGEPLLRVELAFDGSVTVRLREVEVSRE
jgi:hypothetical protein